MNSTIDSEGLGGKIKKTNADKEGQKNRSTIKEKNERVSRKRRLQSCDENIGVQVKKKQLTDEEKDVKPNTDEAYDDLMATFADDFKEDNEEVPLLSNDKEKEIKPNTDEAFEDLMAEFADDFKDDEKEVSSLFSDKNKDIKPNTDEAYDDLMATFAGDFKDDNEEDPLLSNDKGKEIKPNTDEAYEDLMAEFADDFKDDEKEVSSSCEKEKNDKVKVKKDINKDSVREVKQKTFEVKKRSLEEKRKEMVQNMKKAGEPEFPCYDSFFGIRIKSPKIDVTFFETITKDMHKVLVKDIKKTNEDCNEDYVTMGVIIEKSECKVSGNGKNYVVWKVNGFRQMHESSVKVLLFGDCFKSHWKLQQGMTVGIIKPTFGNDDKGKENLTTLMITKETQVIELGFCVDFGICKSMRTDGKPCSNVVNINTTLFCAYHLEKHAKEVASRRGTFNSMYSQPNVKVQRQKLANCHVSPVKKIPITVSSTALPIRKINGALPTKDNIHLLKEMQKQDILKNASKTASCSLNARAILKKQKEREGLEVNTDTKKKKDNVEEFISKLRQNDLKKKMDAKKKPMIGRSFKGANEIIL